MTRNKQPERWLAKAVIVTVLIASALIWAGFKACEHVNIEPEQYPVTENYTEGFTHE